MSSSERGRFIVFEGIDASGKSTQVNRAADYLRSLGRRVHVTAEPTTGPIGSMIRQAFAGRIPMDDRTIAALFVADRIDHLTNERDGILDLIARGFDVISDRYHLSSIAYHSSDVSSDWISGSNELSTDLLRPDLTIYLDISPRTALERLQARTGLSDKFEVLDRLEHAHRAYAEAILDLEKLDNIHLITALGSPDEVLVRVLELMNSTWP